MCLHFIVAEIMYPMLLANKALSWLVLQQCMIDLLIIIGLKNAVWWFCFFNKAMLNCFGIQNIW